HVITTEQAERRCLTIRQVASHLRLLFSPAPHLFHTMRQRVIYFSSLMRPRRRSLRWRSRSTDMILSWDFGKRLGCPTARLWYKLTIPVCPRWTRVLSWL